MNKFHIISFCLLILSSAPLIGSSSSDPNFYYAPYDSLNLADSTDNSSQIKNDEEIKFLYPRLNQHITFGKVPIVWKSSSITKRTGRNWNIQWSPDFGQTWMSIDSVSISDNIYEWQTSNFILPPEHIQFRLINKKNNNEFIRSDIINFDVNSVSSKPYNKPLQNISFAIGANFNFLDGTKVNGLYLGINAFLPNIWSTRRYNFGFDFLLEQGVSTIRDTSLANGSNSKTTSGNIVENKRVGLSSAFLAGIKGIHNIQLALTLEARQCTKQIQSKPIETPKDEEQTQIISNTPLLSESNILFFLGGGIIYRQNISDFDIKFSFSIFSNIIEDYKSYFVARFSLMETTSNIKFGTEVRGPFFEWKARSPHEIFFYIAKEISIKDLFGTFF